MAEIASFIRQILEIIAFPTDLKEELTDGMLKIINDQTFLRLIHALPKSEQDKLSLKLDKPTKEHYYILEYLSHYYSVHDIRRILNHEAKLILKDYLNTVSNLITPQEKAQITEILKMF